MAACFRCVRGVRAIGGLVLAATLASCAGVWPRVLSTADVRAQPTTRGEWLASYDDALASIGAVMNGQLGLPRVEASLYFFRNRGAFQAALESEGYDAAFAQQTAATLIGVSGFRRVLLNNDAVADLDWPERVALLAHELTHTLQYEFSGGTRGASEQWLREGFAEWIEVRVLMALGFTSDDYVRQVTRQRLRALRGGRLPALSEMVAFPQWVALAQGFGQEPIYALALAAAEFLLDQHGIAAAVDYFTLFATSADREENFRRAFGRERSQFEAAFAAHAATLLR